MSQNALFPPLPLDKWESTKNTLHIFLQIVGKIRLTQNFRKNHWWGITLYVSTKGITTGPLPYGDRIFEIEFDFINHHLDIITSDGEHRGLNLYDGLTVADLYDELITNLSDLGLKVEILAKPFDMISKEPFAKSSSYSSYDKHYVETYWKILQQVNMVFNEFSGHFYGKTCPVQLYWHHMDLTVTRFSGKRGPKMETDNIIEKDAYSHECISFGFWAGDENVRGPAFYSYTFPSPEGVETVALKPEKANWIDSNGSYMAILMYDDIRELKNPKKAILDFLESAYQAGAQKAGWDIEDLTVKPLR